MTLGGMDAVEMVRVLEWLDGRAIVYQVNGGWAVDALLGFQSRTHGDLDIFVDAAEVDALIAWLSGRRYVIVEDWRPIRVELRSGHLAVDIDPMEVDAAGDGVQRGFGEETFAHRARDRAVGKIGGRPVVVASAARLVELRSGYELRPEDHHDLELLQHFYEGRG